MKGDRQTRDRRACEICGRALGPGHGNTRYHPGECASEAKRARQRRNQAKYRARTSTTVRPQAPPDFESGRVHIRGVVLPGQDSAAIRAAALTVLTSSLAFHDDLKRVPWTNVLNNPQLLRLRSFVDEAINLVEVLNDAIPTATVSSVVYDASDGLDIVRRLDLNKPRPGARRR